MNAKPSLLGISPKQLNKIQTIMGLLFSIFLCLHLFNTILAVAGPDTYNDIQQRLQGFYQSPIVEFCLVLLPLSVHAFIGLSSLVKRRQSKLKPKQNFQNRLHSFAGIFLLIFVFGHIAATRGIALLADADPGFSGVSFTLQWMPLYFYPYYFLLYLAGFYHAYTGISKSVAMLGYSQYSQSMLNVRRYLISLGAIAGLLALLSFGGVFFTTPKLDENNYVRYYAEMLDLDLKDYQ